MGICAIVCDICMRSRKLVEASQSQSTGSIWSVHVQSQQLRQFGTLAHMLHVWMFCLPIDYYRFMNLSTKR